jgi:predicted esterase
VTLREHELAVRRTARYYTLGDAGPALREVWIACHGYGQLAARFARHFAGIANPHRLIVIPEALSRFYVDTAAREQVGASWMTREHRQSEIGDYVAYLDAVYAAAVGPAPGDARLTAFGFSQGASTVSRWAALGHHAVARLVLWGGELPPDLDVAAAAARFGALDAVIVRGKQDQLVTAKTVAGIVSRFREHGVRHRVVEFEGGHEVDEQVLTALANE